MTGELIPSFEGKEIRTIEQKRKSEQFTLVREWDPDEEKYIKKKVPL